MSEKSGGSNNCDQCHTPLVQGAVCCMQCGKLQGATKNCIRCHSLIPYNANFCPHCTCNQTEISHVQEKLCILCSSALRSDAQYCYLCSYPQDPNALGSVPLKKCVEPTCPALLLHHLPVCYKCQKLQPLHQASLLVSGIQLPESQTSQSILTCTVGCGIQSEKTNKDGVINKDGIYTDSQDISQTLMLPNTPTPVEKEMVEAVHTCQEAELLEDKQNDSISVLPAYIHESENMRQLPPEISTVTKEKDTDQSNDINAAVLKFPDKITSDLTSDEYRALTATKTEEAETKVDVIGSNNEKNDQHLSNIDQSPPGVEKEQLSDHFNELNNTSNSPVQTTSAENLPMTNDQTLSNSIDVIDLKFPHEPTCKSSTNDDITVTGTKLQEDKIKKTTEHLPDQTNPLAVEPSVPNNKILVRFHAVIPKDVWEWDESAKVYMRFGIPELGNWEHDYGPGCIERELPNELIVIRFRIELTLEFVEQHRIIPYKYLVYSNQMKELDDAYEYLYGLPHISSVPNNRCLNLSIAKSNLLPNKCYLQCDTFVFPKSKGKPIPIKKTQSFTSWITGDSVLNFNIPEPSWMRQMCLEIHLLPSKELFLEHTTFYNNYDISTASKGLVQLFESCYNQHYINGQKEYKFCLDSLKEDMKEWLETVTLSLETNEPSPKRLGTAVTLTCVIRRFFDRGHNTHFEENVVIALLRMMALTYATAKKEYSFLKSLMKTEASKKQVIASVTRLLTYAADKLKNRKEYFIDYMKALPLIHFVRDNYNPHEKIEVIPSKVKWGDESLKLHSVRDAVLQNSGLFEEHKEELIKLFSLDLYLVQDMIYVCPRDDLPLLCQYVPIGLVFGWLSDKLKSTNIQKLMKIEVNLCILEPLFAIQSSLIFSEIHGHDCIEGAFLLAICLKEKLQSASDNDRQVARTFAATLLCIVYKLGRVTGSEEPRRQMNSLCVFIIDFLRSWIINSNVIGGSVFGGTVSSNNKSDMELDIWQFMLSLEFEAEVSQLKFKMGTLPSEVEPRWHAIISSLVNERLAQLPKETRIDRFCDLENRQHTSDVIVNIFMAHAAKALDELVFTETSSYSLRSIQRLQVVKSQQVVHLLGNLLLRKYPNFQETVEIPIIDLLEWDLWPGFLNIYVNHSEVAQTETAHENWQLICMCALSQFQALCNKISSGTITVGELNLIYTRKTQMKKLCEVAISNDKVKNDSHDEISSDFNHLSQYLELQLNEFRCFTSYKDQMIHLITHLHSIEVIDLNDLLKQLRENHHSLEITSVCHVLDSGECEVVCFPMAKPLECCYKHFYEVSKKHPSDLFNRFWLEKVSQVVKEDKPLTFQQVVDNVWKPVFDRCLILLDDLKSGKLALSDVDNLFKENYSSDQDHLKKDLYNLNVVINTCNESSENSDWIQSVTDRIGQYWNLCNYHEAAEAFIKIRDMLHLTGDFTLVETVTSQTLSSVREKTLGTIDDSVVETSLFFKTYAKDKKKKECLKAFADCPYIVQWIKKIAKDVNSLQNFVTVALATSAGGEGDMTTDRLSYLRTVGRGFGPLIYNLPQSASFQQLQEHCKTLWETLEHAPNLPEMMRACEKEIEWYKSVKEAQGSVEVTSFGQMRNINSYGSYEVGSSKKNILTSRSDAIHLRLKQSKTKRIHKLQYSLDEIRDLESKLVLITGRESEERKEVDTFLEIFHSVCRVADVLMLLQQFGNNKYIGWTKQFNCDSAEALRRLQVQASEMENDLEDWKKELSDQREKVYELNYFTTPQLLLLREELGGFRSNPEATKPIKHEAMSLLHSLSQEITSQVVKEYVQNINNPTFVKQELVFGTYDELQEDSMLCESFSPTMEQESLPLSDEENEHIDSYSEPSDAELEAKVTIDKVLSSSVSLETPSNSQQEPVEVEQKLMPSKIAIGEEMSINKYHPFVKDLLDAGYPLEQCVTAVKRHPDNIHKAMEYISLLEDSEEDEEVIQDPINEDKPEEDGKYSVKHSNKVDHSDISTKNYLSLLELGSVLQKLGRNYKASVNQSRPFPDEVKFGEPNLLVTKPDHVLKTVLSLYMKDQTLPLPTHEEVLICNEYTTDEEVTLLWKRAMGDPNHYRIFCLVYAEKLSYQVCDKVLRTLLDCSQGQRDYKLVIICSNEDEDMSYVISKLQLYRRPFKPPYPDCSFSEYLKAHFMNLPLSMDLEQNIPASEIDHEKSSVRVVRSERAGMGKSLYIQRLEEKLEAKTQQGPHRVIIPIHGPKVTFDSIVQALKYPFEKTTNQDIDHGIIFHLDISPSVLRQVDSLLFSLLILQAVCDSQGRIWRCHPSHLYVIEVTVPKSEIKFAKCSVTLLNLLPSMECLSPRNVLQMLQNQIHDSMKSTMDEGEFKSHGFQRVFQYLHRHAKCESLDEFSYVESVEGEPAECLQTLLVQCGVKDPSWSELKHFVKFLDIQLKNCENSSFCKKELVGDVLFGFKTFVVKFMIRMSKDFATSSLKGEVATENEELIVNDEQLKEYQIDKRKEWEQNYHPYLFFNEDGNSITFVGFNATPNGDLRDPVKREIIEAGILSPKLYYGLKSNQVDLSENYLVWGKDIMIEKIGMVMGLEWSIDPDPTYVLTVDNVIKIMAIHMRFRCNIPVVIMGETGCGKTRLIRYMCDIAAQGCIKGGQDVKNMLIMKVHGGTTEEDIVNKVEEAEEIADKNRTVHEIDTVLFFDEANTTEAIGLIKEVMCDRHIHGRPIHADVKFIAACNPYRKHTNEMINKLESAGLGFYVKANETQQRLGTIPLRQLVYRVLDLPPSMRPLVYDFGQLNNTTERDYIAQIVQYRCQNIPGVNEQSDIINVVTNVLAWSQSYMRKRNDECSFVSLRDVERAMIVFKYFCENRHLFTEKVLQKAKNDDMYVNEITRALILALSVCYHARLQERGEYVDGVVKQFKSPLVVPGGVEQFCNEIRWCQDVLLGDDNDGMTLGPNIAKNAALRENVFMMAICIELRIPLFLVGKPGSSKSLAKSIVANSMQGKDSEKNLMKNFKEVQIFSYQCSQLSTPKSVIEVFETAKRFQKKQDTTKYVSVVVLDEVGLAEDSPNLPLKALHPLLEDGTEGGDDSQQIIEREERVAFIGISNWALDPAKMNRGVMVTRGDPDLDELELSARGICSNRTNDLVKERLDACFKPLAAAYKDICDKQTELRKSFFGLRDFYSLIKMLYWMCEKSKSPPTGPQLQHAIKRNFGGLKDFDTYDIFKQHISNLDDESDLTNVSEMQKSLLSPDCSPLGLIRKSLQTKETSWHGENRYLLFLTENYSALHVLKHYLHEEVSFTVTKEKDGLEEEKVKQRMEPFVLFGSSFPKDKEYTQVCRNINQIKICMETGRPVILLNLENLYESLYDLLNQHYILLGGGQRYVDLGLQTHRVKCRVHNNFKIILIAEKNTVYKEFPTPLINRLEKHIVLTETVLLDWQKEVLNDLTNWVHQFSKVLEGNVNFTEQDAFIGYQNDTPASVIFQATQLLHQERPKQDEKSEEWKEAVFDRSKKILLQMASPDALIRLHCTALAKDQKYLSQIYFSEQHHGSIVQFLVHHLHNGSHMSGQCGLLIQVTTHSHLLSSQELNELCQCINMKEDQVLCFLLQEFDSEMDFSNKLSRAFFRHNKKDILLIIQCDSGHLYGDLIACARYRIDDEREKAKNQLQHSVHILFIIHLPHQFSETNKHGSSFVGFQGGHWISAHLDDICAPTETALTLNNALSAPISDLFYNGDFILNEEPAKRLERDYRQSPEDMDSESINEQTLTLISEQQMETCIVSVSDKELEGDLDENITGEVEELDLEISNSQKRLDKYLPYYEEELNIPMEYDKFGDDDIPLNGYVTIAKPQHCQCCRLYDCIQAAVAKIIDKDVGRKEWGAHRVKLLLELIPQYPEFPLDDYTFYGALVKHIRNVLRERENVQQDKEWVLKEALSSRKLQIGGTFQNVLERRLDEVIVPIFAAILSFMDHYSNLDLMKPRLQLQDDDSLQQLWVQIFSNDKLCQFSYESFSMGKGIEYQEFQSVVKAHGIVTKEEFSCQFPFFWLIKEAIDLKLENAKNIAGTHWGEVHVQLCDILADDPIASALTVSERHWMEFYKFYCHDFLRSVHQVTHHMAEKEYEIIEKACHAIVTGPNFTTAASSLLSKVAAVHVVYDQYQQEIMWFGQLTTHIPGILEQMETAIDKYSSKYMEVSLYAVKVTINEYLALPLDSDDIQYIADRLVKLQLCQNAINSILTLEKSTTELAREIRHSWQGVRAIQLFVEHVIGKHESMFVDLLPFAKRIKLHLSSETDSKVLRADFTKASTIEKVHSTLHSLNKKIKKNRNYLPNVQKTISECCESYFMEVVSSLSFGQSNPPESALIEKLVTLFTEQRQIKEKPKEIPVMRSFLLQLLLEHNPQEVREHLERYFRRSQVVEDDLSLCLLCIRCLEDGLHKKYSSLHDKIRHGHRVMSEGREDILNSPTPSVEGGIRLQYLEGIAKLRYAIIVMAELLYYKHGTNIEDEGSQSYCTNDTELLLNVVKSCCDDDTLNTDNAGPAVFLVKQLARQYGVSFLTKLTSDPTMQWVVPHHLRRSNEDQQTSDPFVIYQVYEKFRNALTDAVYGQDLVELQRMTEGLNARDAPVLLLGIYQVVTGSCVFTNKAKEVTYDTRGKISTFTKSFEVLNRQLMWTGQALFDNTYCAELEAMLLRPQMSPENRLLTNLVVHVVIALQSKELDILQPFFKMINSPEELKGAFLPAMPEDNLLIARSALGGAFYDCPKGHPYFVSECGKPMQQYTCPQCGSAIGGENHQLISDNKSSRNTGTTEIGYVLGHPDKRETVPASERTLSPAACAIIRALMHASLLWASCNNKHAIDDLLDLTKGQVRPPDLPLFFWQHLEHDIDIFSQAISKSKDDSCLVLHMILKDIVIEERVLSIDLSTHATLSSKNARTEWEKCFNNVYIEPILTKLEATLQQATDLVLADKKEDRDRLFYVIHEKVSVAPEAFLPHLWTYRSRITLEHLYQILQTQKDTYPILHEFLQQEPLLRATQYLPGIVKLQYQMYKHSHRRWDKNDVVQYTIGEFIRGLGKGHHAEQKRSHFCEKLDCVRNAWSLVKDKLKEHSRVPVDPEYLDKATWDESLPLTYLIPTFTGPGACTVVLVDLLVGVHNDFIEKCRSQLKKKQKKDIMWREHKIPVSHIQHCHLLEYEHQLLSIVLSHCHYSLEYGKGQNVIYDLSALEKHVVDRFIHGKPLIQLEIPQVVYRKDVYTAETFANIRKNITPQVKLRVRQQREIVNELDTTQSLRECLDVVEIAIGFLSSGKTDSKTKLEKYVKSVLRLEKKFTSKKAMEYCTLGHILSLWETLSVEIARTLTLSKEEPFHLLGQEFLQTLDKNVENELRGFLRGVDIPPLLNLLYEFIETNVQHRSPDEKNWPLIDTVVAHLDSYGLEGLPPQFEEQFPQTITVDQAVATWKAIVFYQQQHEHDIKS